MINFFNGQPSSLNKTLDRQPVDVEQSGNHGNGHFLAQILLWRNKSRLIIGGGNVERGRPERFFVTATRLEVEEELKYIERFAVAEPAETGSNVGGIGEGDFHNPPVARTSPILNEAAAFSTMLEEDDVNAARLMEKAVKLRAVHQATDKDDPR
jgi:hypothetical protein